MTSFCMSFNEDRLKATHALRGKTVDVITQSAGGWPMIVFTDRSTAILTFDDMDLDFEVAAEGWVEIPT